MTAAEFSYWLSFAGKTCRDLSGPIHDLGQVLGEFSNAVNSLGDYDSDLIEVRPTEESIPLETPTVGT